jgi:hypothetical protein
LENLAGYGAAFDWGMNLKADIEAPRASEFSSLRSLTLSRCRNKVLATNQRSFPQVRSCKATAPLFV